MNGRPMPADSAAWAKIAAQILGLLMDLARGESLTVTIYRDARRGLIISKFGKAWTPRNDEAA